MSRSKTKERLRAKLLKQNGVTMGEQKILDVASRLAGVRANIRTKLDKSVKRKRFDKLEYKYFSKYNFLQYLYMMADDGNSFDKIDQETVDGLDMMMRENNSYEQFAADHSQDWMETDGAMRAFKYLFECRHSM
jgi:hypothetical protein